MYDCIIIGAGIVGLATAYKALQANPDLSVAVIEKEGRVAAHQTGHNSGVIHAGIYYKPGSLKARNCRAGVSQMLAFCEEHEIPVNRCGKVIVATDPSEIARLAELYRRGQANGVPNLQMVSSEQLKEIEPHAHAVQALWSPQTAIVDYCAVAEALRQEVETRGGRVLLCHGCRGIVHRADGITVKTDGGELSAHQLINCGGAWSDELARMAGERARERIVPFRGEYFCLRPEKAQLIRGLIYPVPDPTLPFLGVHITRMIDGNVEAGPNAVLALAKDGYKKTSFRWRDARKIFGYSGFWRMAGGYWSVGAYEMYRSLNKRAFLRSLQKLLPDLTLDDLMPGGSGVRAQLVEPSGALSDDFCIKRSERMVHVLNAPSPGATASLAIADYIVQTASLVTQSNTSLPLYL